MRNSVEEAFLDFHKVPYRYEESIPISLIDFDRSRDNQGRIGTSCNQSTVDLYASSMLAGANFPAPWLVKLPDGKYLTLSGNHRNIAKRKAGFEATDAYVIETDDEQVLEMLSRSANTLVAVNGQSLEERVEQAYHLVTKYNYPVTKAATLWGIEQVTLNRRLQIAKAAERVVRLTGEYPDRKVAPPAVLHALSKVQNDNAFKALYGVAVEAGGLSGQTVEPIAIAVGKATTEARQLEIVEELRRSDEVQDSIRRKQGTPLAQKRVRDKFFKTMRSLVYLIEENPSCQLLQLTDGHDREQARELKARLDSVMEGVFGGQEVRDQTQDHLAALGRELALAGGD